MLMVFFRRAASPPCARFWCLVALGAYAWVIGARLTQAADTEPSRQVASVPFEHYRGWRDEPLQDWRAANERVGEIGGWRTYLRESQPEGDDSHQGGHGHHGVTDIEEAP